MTSPGSILLTARARACLVLATLVLTVSASPLFAQGASPYLPLDHEAYDAIGLWIARGDIATLSPFTRPYRTGDVVAALERLDPDHLSPAEAGVRRRLLAELRQPDGGGLIFDLGAEVGGRFVTQSHPDPLQPRLAGRFGDDRLLERAELNARVASPYVAGAVRVRRDGIYRHDPRFPDGQVTPRRDAGLADDLSLRVEEGYVEAQIPYLRISLGRMDRDWGPATIDGFLRSANTYSQDEIGYRIGTERVFLVGTISAPGDFGADTVRHVSMHRLEVRPSDRFAFAVSESVVYGGPDGRFRFELANPVGIWTLALDDAEVAHNKVGQVDAWWRIGRGITVNGSVLADATNREGSCCQMGGSLGAEVSGLLPGVRIGGQVTAVQSLAYRTSRPWEEYSIDRVGLGWDKSDLVLVTFEADWFATATLLLSPRLDVQRKGEGDFRQPRPAFDDLPDQPRILSGVVETTVRPSVGGRWTYGDGFRVAAVWDFGVSFITDYAHVEGDDRTAFTGSLAIRLFTPRWGFRPR